MCLLDAEEQGSDVLFFGVLHVYLHIHMCSPPPIPLTHFQAAASLHPPGCT